MCVKLRVTDEHEFAYPFTACTAAQLRAAMGRARHAYGADTAHRPAAWRNRLLYLQVKATPGDTPSAWAGHSSVFRHPVADPDMSDARAQQLLDGAYNLAHMYGGITPDLIERHAAETHRRALHAPQPGTGDAEGPLGL